MAGDISKLLQGFRNDIVTHVRSSEENVREEIRTFRDEVDTRFREVFNHFEAIYNRLDRLASLSSRRGFSK